MNKLSNKQLNKMEQMLKAIHNPNFEKVLKSPHLKDDILRHAKREGKNITEMDIVNHINNGKKND